MKEKIKFSADLMCPSCRDVEKPIEFDRNTNVWWHICGWSEKGKSA